MDTWSSSLVTAAQGRHGLSKFWWNRSWLPPSCWSKLHKSAARRGPHLSLCTGLGRAMQLFGFACSWSLGGNQ